MKKLFFILAAMLAFTPFLQADIAPAEQISYEFKFSGMSPLKIVPAQSEQIQCADNQCLEPKALGRFGIQKLECNESSCYAVSYKLDHFQKLIIKFEDGRTLESEVFPKPKGRKSLMSVTVTPQGLKIEQKKSGFIPDRLPISYMASSFAFVFLVEILTALMLANSGKLPFSIVSWFAVFNAITIPVNWILLSSCIQSDGILWAAAFLFEFLFLCFIYRRRGIMGQIFSLTLFANVAGYSAGMILSYLTTFF